MRVLLGGSYPAGRLGARIMLEQTEEIEVVAEIQSAEEILSRIEELRPDLVILDFDLEGEASALEACREVKSLPCPPRVLVYAACSSQRTIIAADLVGADGYLHKGLGCGERLPEVAVRIHEGQRDWILGPIQENGPEGLRAKIEGAGLTDREREVLSLLMEGRTNREISHKLCLSLNTVKTHVKKVLRKLGVESRRELSG
ncbi:DNA-binding response regulator [Rubrobacter xylanophilus]|uniref:DNA-binding response regulator n=1 Tax=Rubrobacter xylanophilus TaxID=49319 RepID=A0A510HHJ0_9ACTN|nr:DNA-binding response regulator [Rubrobacter xylanophilus]